MLTIQIDPKVGIVVARCVELGLECAEVCAADAVVSLMQAIDDALFEGCVSGDDWWIRDRRYADRRQRRDEAFLNAYPKIRQERDASEFPGTFVNRVFPCHIWDCDALWDQAQELAEDALIEHGKDHPFWTAYVQAVLSHSYRYWHMSPEQRSEMMRRWIDWGFPVPDVEQMGTIAADRDRWIIERIPDAKYRVERT